MEIYTNAFQPADRTIFIEAPVVSGASIDVYAYIEDEQVFEWSTITAVGVLGYNVILPLFLLQSDALIDVRWTLTYLDPADNEEYTFSKSVPVSIVTPILTKAEIIEVWDTATPAEVIKIERAVRHIVQAYTGQEFGRFVGTYKVRGTNGSALMLPRRLITLESFNGTSGNSPSFAVTEEGYILRYSAWGIPPVKADYHGLHIHTGGVIHNPNNVRWQKFDERTYYEVKGEWGWRAVPEQVKEAAKLLVNDYACADSQYRDRYLVSMTAADWRIQFNSGAYLRTGNVRADQLLSDYVVTRGWGVI